MNQLFAPEPQAPISFSSSTAQNTSRGGGDQDTHDAFINGLWVRVPSFGFFGMLIYDKNVRTFGGDTVYTTSEPLCTGLEVYVKYEKDKARLCVWDWQYDPGVAETTICPLSNESFIKNYSHEMEVNNTKVNAIWFYSFYNAEEKIKRNQVKLIDAQGVHQLAYTSVVEGLPHKIPDTTWSFFEHKRLKTEPKETPQPYVPGLLGCTNIQLLLNNGKWVSPVWGQTELVPPAQNNPNFTLVVQEPNAWVLKKK